MAKAMARDTCLMSGVDARALARIGEHSGNYADCLLFSFWFLSSL
jgi:hypothetical protein